MRSQFINSRETLISISEWPDGKCVTNESKDFGTVTDDAEDIAANLYGNEFMFIRYDIESGYPKNPENVTEEVARAWLALNASSATGCDEVEKFPKFVREFLDDNPEYTPSFRSVDPNAEHRLSKVQLGVGGRW